MILIIISILNGKILCSVLHKEYPKAENIQNLEQSDWNEEIEQCVGSLTIFIITRSNKIPLSKNHTTFDIEIRNVKARHWFKENSLVQLGLTYALKRHVKAITIVIRKLEWY